MIKIIKTRNVKYNKFPISFSISFKSWFSYTNGSKLHFRNIINEKNANKNHDKPKEKNKKANNWVRRKTTTKLQLKPYKNSLIARNGQNRSKRLEKKQITFINEEDDINKSKNTNRSNRNTFHCKGSILNHFKRDTFETNPTSQSETQDGWEGNNTEKFKKQFTSQWSWISEQVRINNNDDSFNDLNKYDSQSSLRNWVIQEGAQEPEQQDTWQSDKQNNSEKNMINSLTDSNNIINLQKIKGTDLTISHSSHFNKDDAIEKDYDQISKDIVSQGDSCQLSLDWNEDEESFSDFKDTFNPNDCLLRKTNNRSKQRIGSGRTISKDDNNLFLNLTQLDNNESTTINKISTIKYTLLNQGMTLIYNSWNWRCNVSRKTTFRKTPFLKELRQINRNDEYNISLFEKKMFIPRVKRHTRNKKLFPLKENEGEPRIKDNQISLRNYLLPKYYEVNVYQKVLDEFFWKEDFTNIFYTECYYDSLFTNFARKQLFHRTSSLRHWKMKPFVNNLPPFIRWNNTNYDFIIVFQSIDNPVGIYCWDDPIPTTITKAIDNTQSIGLDSTLFKPCPLKIGKSKNDILVRKASIISPNKNILKNNFIKCKSIFHDSTIIRNHKKDSTLCLNKAAFFKREAGKSINESPETNQMKNSMQRNKKLIKELRPITHFKDSINKNGMWSRTHEWKYQMLQSLSTHEEALIFYIKDQNFCAFKETYEKYSLDPELKDEYSNSLLSLAVQSNSLATVEYLLNFGASPNSYNYKMNTPLHFALTYHNFEIADMWIKRGADESVKNIYGCTPWDCWDSANSVI